MREKPKYEIRIVKSFGAGSPHPWCFVFAFCNSSLAIPLARSLKDLGEKPHADAPRLPPTQPPHPGPLVRLPDLRRTRLLARSAVRPDPPDGPGVGGL